MSVIERVDAGDADGVVALLAGLSPAERRAALPELKQRRKEYSENWWARSHGQHVALLVAGIGCNTAPSAAVSWASGVGSGAGLRVWQHPAVLAVVDRQPVAWQVEVLRRLADRRPSAWVGGDDYPVIERLAAATDTPVPVTDGVVLAWQDHHHSSVKNGPERESRLSRLARNPATTALLPALFDVEGTGNALHDDWRSAIRCLVEAGVAQRGDILDRSLARLARDGRPGDLRGHLRLLEELAASPEECAARVRAYLALLDGSSTAAAHAQAQLANADEAGLLEPEHLVEASATVFFRSEKKLLRTQLAWLDRSGRRSPAFAAAAVRGAIEAFGQSDVELQERALKVAARHLKAAGPGLLPELAAAVEQLPPAQSGRAAALFGLDAPIQAGTGSTRQELLPPLPQRVPLAPLDGPVAVAQELAAVLAGDQSVAAMEATLDGLVRESFLDVESLRAALKPVLGEREWIHEHLSWLPPHTWIGAVAAAAAGQLPAAQAHALLQGQDLLRSEQQEPFRAVLAARIQEAAALIVLGQAPFLLATPSYADGGLEAAVLVERLAALEAADGRAGAADFGQALLRVLPTEEPAVLSAAAELRSSQGRRLAQWLTEGGLPRQSTERIPAEERTHLWVTQPGLDPEERPQLYPALQRLLGPQVNSRGRHLFAADQIMTAYALAVLPSHREELAARLAASIIAATRYSESTNSLLPQLVEAGGPAGPAVQLVVACVLGSATATDRTAAVDALLLLAAQGALDADRLGADLAEAVRSGVITAARVSLALRQAAESGAYGTVWSVLRAALPGLLAPEPIRGVPELLAIAADCAARTGARGALPAVEQLATQRGSSRLLKEARALHAVLTAG